MGSKVFVCLHGKKGFCSFTWEVRYLVVYMGRKVFVRLHGKKGICLFKWEVRYLFV